MVDGVGFTADMLAAAGEALAGSDERFIAHVATVNPDGTVNVLSGFGGTPNVPALASYSPRAAGDTVLCVKARQGPVVVGAAGQPAAQRAFTLSDSSAPGGQGWEEVVSGQVWAKGDGSLWVKRVVAAPPPAGTTLTWTAGRMVAYRGGTQLHPDYAEVGDYTGRGLCTGLAAVFGSWAALGVTATGGTLAAHRRAAGHGFTYGRVAVYAYPCLAAGVPPSPPSAVTGQPVQLTLALNEAGSVAVPAWWAQPFADGTADSVLFYTPNARENVELDSCTLTVIS